MVELISKSENETEAAGSQLGRCARRGWAIGLSGELGAGKTAWARGFARGLGYQGRVQSPTFALLNEYDGGKLRMFHLDLYRLETAEAVWTAGLDEYLFHPDGVAVIEWWERVGASTVAGNVSAIGLGLGLKGGQWPTIRVRIEIIDESVRQILYDDSWT